MDYFKEQEKKFGGVYNDPFASSEPSNVKNVNDDSSKGLSMVELMKQK